MTDETLLGTGQESTAPAAQQTTDAGAAPAEGNPPATQTEAPTVPESYEFTAPEGMTLDGDAATALADWAKEHKLPQDAAQKVADIGIQMVQRQMEAYQAQVAQWADAVRTDKEIGGDKLAENLGVARKAIQTFGGAELREVLNSTGLGNHPVLVKAFHRIGKAIAEDGFVRGGATTTTDPAAAFFPSMFKKG